MHLLRQRRRSIAILLILALGNFSIISVPAHAAMVNTAEIFKQSKHNLACEHINMFLDRSEVHKHLVAWGVNAEEAKARVDSLGDQEIEKIAARIDQLPAGGGALGTIVGAALVIFIVLLITDILGFTNVFPFVKSR
ncbi:MAG: PA2779 family protein [Thermodesulfobacteriota bacterium]|nr:PA2779 family protein [Thermodesulfobacteriota bacterium]